MSDIPHSVVDYLTVPYSMGFIFLIVLTFHIGIPLQDALSPLILGYDGLLSVAILSVVAIAVSGIWKDFGVPIWFALIALTIVLVGVV